MVPIMNKMIWRNILRMKYLAIFVFCILIIIPYFLQAGNLPKEQIPTNFVNTSFLDKVILNVESFDFLSFLNKDIPEFVDCFSFFSFLADSPSDISTKNDCQNATNNSREIVDKDADEVFHIVIFLSVICGIFIIFYYGLWTQRLN